MMAASSSQNQEKLRQRRRHARRRRGAAGVCAYSGHHRGGRTAPPAADSQRTPPHIPPEEARPPRGESGRELDRNRNQRVAGSSRTRALRSLRLAAPGLQTCPSSPRILKHIVIEPDQGGSEVAIRRPGRTLDVRGSSKEHYEPHRRVIEKLSDCPQGIGYRRRSPATRQASRNTAGRVWAFGSCRRPFATQGRPFSRKEQGGSVANLMQVAG